MGGRDIAYIPYNTGQYNLTPPTTPTSGTLVPLQVDGQGNLKVTETGTISPNYLAQILAEVRATRRILQIVYAESGEGDLSFLVESPEEPTQVEF